MQLNKMQLSRRVSTEHNRRR